MCGIKSGDGGRKKRCSSHGRPVLLVCPPLLIVEHPRHGCAHLDSKIFGRVWAHTCHILYIILRTLGLPWNPFMDISGCSMCPRIPSLFGNILKEKWEVKSPLSKDGKKAFVSMSACCWRLCAPSMVFPQCPHWHRDCVLLPLYAISHGTLALKTRERSIFTNFFLCTEVPRHKQATCPTLLVFIRDAGQLPLCSFSGSNTPPKPNGSD